MIAVSYSKKDFVSKMQSENITDVTVEDTNDYYICIDSTGGPNSEPYFKQFHPNVLNLCFDDVAEDQTNWGEDIQSYYKAVAPTLTQIQHISNFLKDACGTIHVHCMKGESRSKAVADYVSYRIHHYIVGQRDQPASCHDRRIRMTRRLYHSRRRFRCEACGI